MKRCLFVDDEPLILSTIRRLLRAEPYDVVLALGPHAALAACRETAFDVVVSDYHMPDMTGIELLRAVRELSPQSARLLLTGFSCPTSTASAVADGTIERVLHKPFERDTVVEAIRGAFTARASI